MAEAKRTPLSRRVRIVNDTGIGRKTQILDVDTGEDLTARMAVTRIDITSDARESVVAHLSIMAIIDVQAVASIRTLELFPTHGAAGAHITVDTYDPFSIDDAIRALEELKALRQDT